MIIYSRTSLLCGLVQTCHKSTAFFKELPKWQNKFGSVLIVSSQMCLCALMLPVSSQMQFLIFLVWKMWYPWFSKIHLNADLSDHRTELHFHSYMTSYWEHIIIFFILYFSYLYVNTGFFSAQRCQILAFFFQYSIKLYPFSKSIFYAHLDLLFVVWFYF